MPGTTDLRSGGRDTEPGHLTVDGFGAPHAFTTRAGGVSRGSFASLNLGRSVPDDPDAVEANRRLVLDWFGASEGRVATMHQVHGTTVVDAERASPEVRADAIVSDDPTWTIAVSAADCVPLLLHDRETGAVAGVHAGWRGTAAGVVGTAVAAMTRRFGTRPELLTAAIGPCISGDRYQVGPEVVRAFREAGMPDRLARPDEDAPDRYRLSVADAVRHALAEAGVSEGAILGGGWCTASRPELFFSHRRDEGRTGRHWALIRATGTASRRTAAFEGGC